MAGCWHSAHRCGCGVKLPHSTDLWSVTCFLLQYFGKSLNVRYWAWISLVRTTVEHVGFQYGNVLVRKGKSIPAGIAIFIYLWRKKLKPSFVSLHTSQNLTLRRTSRRERANCLCASGWHFRDEEHSVYLFYWFDWNKWALTFTLITHSQKIVCPHNLVSATAYGTEHFVD